MLFVNTLRRRAHTLKASVLEAELSKCLNCASKPCMRECPVSCSPADFIQAALDGKKSGGPARLSDASVKVAAAEIMRMNPLGGVCGAVCPDTYCMSACKREALDAPINIPAVQASLVEMARSLQSTGELVRESFPLSAKKSREDAAASAERKRVAVIGAGPAGLAAASVLVDEPCIGEVSVFDACEFAGGAMNTIPRSRLSESMLQGDIGHIESLAASSEAAATLNWRLGEHVSDVDALCAYYDAVCVATGLSRPRTLSVENERDATLAAVPFLWRARQNVDEARALVAGKRVAVIGGGAVAVDVATTAVELGARGTVTMFYRRGIAEMPVTAKERERLLECAVDVVPRQLPIGFAKRSDGHYSMRTRRVELPPRHSSAAAATHDDVAAADEFAWNQFDVYLVAIGDERSAFVDGLLERHDNVVLAGDVSSGASTVVHSSSQGKEAARDIVERVLGERALERQTNNAFDTRLRTSFCGVDMLNPFVLSASPLSDSLAQVDAAFRAGWAGTIIKTAFADDHSIHVPNHYMARLGDGKTYGNCDNVSDRPMSTVVSDIVALRSRWQSRRLIGASTGGDMSGDLAHDRASWAANTNALEDAGAHLIEYSLSCPQGAEGDESSQIVSQSPELSARVVEWVLDAATKPDVPKIFKLTGAVASVKPVLAAIDEVFSRYSHCRAGVTLANSFPTLTFDVPVAPHSNAQWPRGVVVGMAGAGVLPISYLSLAEATDAFPHMSISANGGIVDAHSAANVIALGCQSVQLCTLPSVDGIDVVRSLSAGLKQLLIDRGIASVSDLVGLAHKRIGQDEHASTVEGFMDLPAKHQHSTLAHPDLCVQCGNCTRCPYNAISLDFDDASALPQIDTQACVGCALCVLKCPTQALDLQ
jgi:dihydropyrimidine dehydrogenase (NAD+) subunit PreA